MKRIFFILFFGLLTRMVIGQTYEIGLSVGGSNYIGDVGPTTYLSPTHLGLGVVGKWNRSERHSFRASFMYLPVGRDDADSDDVRRRLRGYSFDNSIKEISLGIEYTFWEFDYYSTRNQFVPYLYSGLTAISYGSLALDQNNEIRAFADAWTAAIPLVVGAKFQVSRSLRLAFESGVRYTFTDNIDGSDPNGELKGREDLKFGNLNTDDWYVYSGITLFFTFGRKPCYCNF